MRNRTEARMMIGTIGVQLDGELDSAGAVHIFQLLVSLYDTPLLKYRELTIRPKSLVLILLTQISKPSYFAVERSSTKTHD